MVHLAVRAHVRILRHVLSTVGGALCYIHSQGVLHRDAARFASDRVQFSKSWPWLRLCGWFSKLGSFFSASKILIWHTCKMDPNRDPDFENYPYA